MNTFIVGFLSAIFVFVGLPICIALIWNLVVGIRNYRHWKSGKWDADFLRANLVWGEQSCLHFGRCENRPSSLTCNVKCKGYKEIGCKPDTFKPEDEDLDWDACIPIAPARPHGTVKVKLKYAGRSKPIPYYDDA